MIPRTLFTRLALALALLLLGVGVLYAVLSTSLTRHYQQEFLQNLNRDLAARLVTERHLLVGGMLDQAALKKTFQHYMMVNPSIEIYLLDARGNILSYSAEPGEVERESVDMQPVQNFIQGEAFPILGDDPRSYERRKIFSVTSVPTDDGSMKYLYVVLRGEEYERVERTFEDSFMLQLSTTALFVSLLVGLGVGLLLFLMLTRRLQTLSDLMSSFNDSNFTQHEPYPERGGNNEISQVDQQVDEIDTLGRQYNNMAEHIRELLDDIKKQDELRRELVANVSHDLRTPLAALQGYIETLKLKAADFDAETRAEYLDTALHHSQRLTRLVEELFELARLDAQETQLHFEPLALAELVQDVIQKFQLLAETGKVELSMYCPQPLLQVRADIGLLERVLENLLSNALRHTPEGGKITISLRAQGQSSVEVMVEDTGVGIPAQDLPHIFDRSYRGENRQRSGHHAGLGLAIAQHIVMLHGGKIAAASEPGQGARFSLSLQTWKSR